MCECFLWYVEKVRDGTRYAGTDQVSRTGFPEKTGPISWANTTWIPGHAFDQCDCLHWVSLIVQTMAKLS